MDVDMSWIPGQFRIESTVEPPPPIPPKIMAVENERKKLDHLRDETEPEAPALPPKPMINRSVLLLE